jgi:hypothetical protein
MIVRLILCDLRRFETHAPRRSPSVLHAATTWSLRLRHGPCTFSRRFAAENENAETEEADFFWGGRGQSRKQLLASSEREKSVSAFSAFSVVKSGAASRLRQVVGDRSRGSTRRFTAENQKNLSRRSPRSLW